MMEEVQVRIVKEAIEGLVQVCRDLNNADDGLREAILLLLDRVEALEVEVSDLKAKP